MTQKTAKLVNGSLFGMVILAITVVVFGAFIRKPELFMVAQDQVPHLLYGGLGLLCLGWIVTVGLFFGRGWARIVAAFGVVGLLTFDFLQASGTLSQPLNLGDERLSGIVFRLMIFFEIFIVGWGLTLLYLLMAPPPGETKSSLSVEVLNTK